MLLLDLSLPTASENLALDEALLEAAENAAPIDASDLPSPSHRYSELKPVERAGVRGEVAPTPATELLRLWESPQIAVVLGRSCKVADEVRLAECEATNVPILRRPSGGGTVVIGPGCLMYSLVLSYGLRPHLRMLDEVHRLVLSTTAGALNRLLGDETVQMRGTSDLAWHDLKISGNSVRCKRHFLLYHGTLLYDFDLRRVEQPLRSPPRQPDYRAGRDHLNFVTNLAVSSQALRQAIMAAWSAFEPSRVWPRDLAEQLLNSRYLRREWNLER